MKRREGMAERCLRWAVDDTEATEGLLGDLQEEWSGKRGKAAKGFAYQASILAVAARYTVARLVGRAPRGIERSGSSSGDGIGREFRFAFRSLLRAPSHTALFMATLALGIGATTAVFTVLEGVVLRPLAYDDAEALVRLESAVPGLEPDTRWHLAKAQFLYFRDEVTTLSEMGLYVSSVATVGSIEEPDQQATRVRTALVNPDMARILRVRPTLGRTFTEDESLTLQSGVVVLTDGYWRRAFGADAGIVGRSILVNGRPAEVVGVLPPGARLPEEAVSRDNPIDLWLPLYLNPAEKPVNAHMYRAIGRLTPGTEVTEANTELATLSARLPDALPTAYSDQFMDEFGFKAVATPLREDVVGAVAGTLWIVFGSVALLLVVAVFNAANLLLARTHRRGRELAIRAALGAGRSALTRQLLLESIIVCVVAGLAGLTLAAWGVQFLVANAPAGVPRLDEVALGGFGATFSLGLALLLGLAMGVLPTLGSPQRTRVLGDTGRGLTPSRRHHAVRRLLVVGQLAVSVVLLAGASLLFQSFQNLRRVDTGLTADHVLTFRVILPSESYGNHQLATQFYRQAAEALEAQASVTRVGLVSALPLDGYDGCAGTQFEDQPLGVAENAACLPVFLVGPGYFESMGVPVDGETVTWADLDQDRVVAVVGQSTADRFWTGEDALGRNLNSYGAGFVPVTGTAGDVRGAGLDEPVWDAVYLSMTPPGGEGNWAVPRFMHFTVRTDGTDPMTLVPIVRRIVAAVDPQVPLSDIRPMGDIISAATATDSFVASLLGIASVVSLLLSTLGVYAVISYIVQGRRAEIGIRLALGAKKAEVQRLVVGQSVTMAALGVLLGLVGTVSVAGLLGSLLYEVSPTDPLILGAVGVALIAMAGAAAFVPSLRATRVDPVEALRAE